MKKLASLCVTLLLILDGSPCFAQVQSKQRTFTGGRFALEVGGQATGFLKRLDGGEISAVVTQNGSKKQIGSPVYGELEAEVGLGMGKALQEWITAALQGKQTRPACTVVIADSNNQITSKREFQDAIISEVAIPALDAASKDAGYLTVKIAPQVIKVSAPSGKLGGEVGPKQKSWLTSNFKLSIDGLDCTRVSKIESFSFKQAGQGGKSETGVRREASKSTGSPEFTNLKVTISAASIQTWTDWHKSFVVEGKNSDKEERSGTLDLLGPDMKSILATIKFQNVGIFFLAEDSRDANSEKVQTVVAELYFEGMTVEFAP